MKIDERKNARKSAFFRKEIKITYKNIFFKDISASYAKIFGETNFQPREFPRSGSKAKDGKERRKRERLKVGNNNGQLRIANGISGGACKAARAKN